MAFQVMHTDHRLIDRSGEPLGQTRSDQQCAGQPWPLGKRDRIECCPVHARLAHYPLDKPSEPLDVVSRGKLGHHAAVGCVQGHLTVEGLGQDLPGRPGTCLAAARAWLGTNQCHPRLVTGGLDAQHVHDRAHLPETPMSEILMGFPGPSPATFFGKTSTMPVVRVKENEPFEAALRRFKRTIEKIGLLTELRAREFYEKPTAERKRKKAAAVKRHYKRVRSMMLPKRKY